MGAVIEVVAVGRVDVQRVGADHGYLQGLRTVHLRDSDIVGIGVHSTDAALLASVSATVEQLLSLRQRLRDVGEASGELRGVVVSSKRPSAAHALISLDVATQRRHDELCATDLDRPALKSLERLYRLWGVSSEGEAYEQVLSFAACASLSRARRAQALGITNTAQRLQLAHRGLERLVKLSAARLAVREALA